MSGPLAISHPAEAEGTWESRGPAHSAALPSRERSPLDVTAWLVILATLLSLALIRIELTDVPVQLASAREAFRTGQWITKNTFSYTHPDYPVYQQYALYQWALFSIFQHWGWVGLSVFHLVAWTAIFALTIHWCGGFRKAVTHPLVWMIMLLGLQRRMTLRPDIGTLLCLLAILITLDAYRRRPWLASGLLVVWQWCFVNVHQLYLIGLVILGVFWVEVAWRRWGGRTGTALPFGRLFADTEPLPLLPITLGCLGAVLACLGTPLGWEIVKGPAHTFGSLSHHRKHIAEFASVWTSGYDMIFSAIGLGAGVAGFVKRRGRFFLFELGFFVLSIALTLAAIRGVVFLVLAGVGSYARSLRISPVRSGGERSHPSPLFSWRFAAIVATCTIGAFILNERWIVRARMLGGSQFGVGKALGAWPESVMAWLRVNTPKGPLVNLTDYSGNALVWELFPQVKVFADPRFESYPRAFLLEALDAVRQPPVFDRILATHKPGWLYLETAFPWTRAIARRLTSSPDWALVYADTMALVVVSREQNPELAKRFVVDLERLVPADLDAHPDIRAQQWIRWAALMRDFGLPAAEEGALAHASETGGRFRMVQRALEAYPARNP